ncbi:HAD family phosphatase [Candidatus Parcubacteria bacterium]|nr:HAD family phosphatase [Candidatus Parcubacteria bacterium]
MKKAFIFDLDGVLIDDEKIWETKKQKMYRDLFGDEITEKMGSTLGINMDGIYKLASTAGAKTDKESFLKAFYDLAQDIYQTAPIPVGLDKLATSLKELGYRMGIVSASPLDWITTVTKRLPFEEDIELIISLHERVDLKHKPAPDGYLEAIRILQASPKTTIILEDSNSGIKAAKS